MDGVVAGSRNRANVDLAETIGLEMDDGIIVNEFLRNSQS